MAAVQFRSPLGALDDARLQRLTSVKNCQNAITASLASPSGKGQLASPGKRSISAISFDDTDDAENVDPSLFNSPSKRSKNVDGTPIKAARFILQEKARPITSPLKPSSLSVPNTTTTTPISASRGSPKHKRIGLLSKGRRASSSPFRRIDPPLSTSGLPFSIDEALKGTISGYKPKPVAQDLTAEKPIPKSWFFDIHVDTPEEEAANLMEHSASVLDISSDDDATTRQRNELREKGKENIPPPEFVASRAIVSATTSTMITDSNAAATPAPQINGRDARNARTAVPDAMVEDRKALGELPVHEFYGEGLDANSKITVQADDNTIASPRKPSGLSREFDFSLPAVPSPKAKLDAVKAEKGKGRAVVSEEEERQKQDVQFQVFDEEEEL